jgi:hypothetical protein
LVEAAAAASKEFIPYGSGAITPLRPAVHSGEERYTTSYTSTAGRLKNSREIKGIAHRGRAPLDRTLAVAGGITWWYQSDGREAIFARIFSRFRLPPPSPLGSASGKIK